MEEDMTEKGNRYFASANSAEGFVSYFGEVFGACRRLYVIKGGPGTGKSRFMSEVAKRAHEVERYYCSSDASSLDGILIDGWVGLVDGTAPHVWEPYCVGAFEQIVNLGEFWNERLLTASRAEIEMLSEQKRNCYSQAYAYLAAIGQAERGIDGRLREALMKDKLRRAASRFLRDVKGDCRAKRQIGLCSAIGMMGQAHFDTYEKQKISLAISDGVGLAWFLLEELDTLCRVRGISGRVAPSALFPQRLEAIELTGQGLSFFAGEGEDVVYMKKFFDVKKMRALRPVLRGTRETQNRLKDYALEALARASEAHFALEKIYSETMDFRAKEQFTEEFCKKLFG